MNSIKTFPKEKIKIKKLKNLKKPLIKIPKLSNPLTNSPSQKDKGRKEISWDNYYILKKNSKIYNNDTSREKINRLSNKKSNNISAQKIDCYLKQNTTRNSMINKNNNTSGNGQLYPRSRLTSCRLKMLSSAKSRMNNLTQRNIFSPILKNGFNLNYVDVNSTNLINLDKIWDELGINKQYRKYFRYIYKELDPNYKAQLYQKEIEDTNSVKNCLKDLKYFINLRKEDLSDIKILNDKLGQELINKNSNGKEIILNQISDRFISLREHTVNICKSMRKLKYYVFSINNLDKYNFDLLSKKFDFDKNYIIKMKSELNFLRDGFTKYYFNIENDQTPFLLKASDETKISEGDYFLRVIPITDKIRNEILDCNFYIHQELIAYQSANFSKKNFRCISPIKKDEFFEEKKINLNELKGSITERRKDEKINGIGDRVGTGSLAFWPELKKYKDIDIIMENKKKKKRTIEINKNGSSNNIYRMNQFNIFIKKDNFIKKKIKENNNNSIKINNDKSESKIEENIDDKNLDNNNNNDSNNQE